jgi:hypothetical protein
MIAEEIQNVYKIIPLTILRKTPGIHFDAVSENIKVDGIDRVVHAADGISPPPSAGVDRRRKNYFDARVLSDSKRQKWRHFDKFFDAIQKL